MLDNVQRDKIKSYPRESATEKIPPALLVRVKRCGKSAPCKWQHLLQGKPHLEQDQIEAKSFGSMCLCIVFCLGRLHEVIGNYHPRGMIAQSKYFAWTEPGL